MMKLQPAPGEILVNATHEALHVVRVVMAVRRDTDVSLADYLSPLRRTLRISFLV
jgi:hypothetical protein